MLVGSRLSNSGDRESLLMRSDRFLKCLTQDVPVSLTMRSASRRKSSICLLEIMAG